MIGTTGRRKIRATAEFGTTEKMIIRTSLLDDEGQVHEWSGRGRTPVAFKEYFEKHGVSKEDTRI